MSTAIVNLVLVLGYTVACLEVRCRCFQKLRIIDSTAVGLRSMPHLKSTLENYTIILLRDNYLQHLNFPSLFKVPPRVVLLDLRDNNPLLLHNIMRFQPPKPIKIISDCNYSTTEIPTYSTLEIPATRKTKPDVYAPSIATSDPKGAAKSYKKQKKTEK